MTLIIFFFESGATVCNVGATINGIMGDCSVLVAAATLLFHYVYIIMDSQCLAFKIVQ